MGKPENFRAVWPTIDGVRESNEGWYAGCSIPGEGETARLLPHPACLLQHWMLVFDWHHMVSFEVTWHSRAAHDTANTHNSESI